MSAASAIFQTKTLSDSIRCICSPELVASLLGSRSRASRKAACGSSPAGFRAKTSATRVSAPEYPAHVQDSGGRWLVAFAWYDRRWRLWRTWQRSFTEGWARFSETWPASAMTRDGFAFRPQTAEHGICESASGLWPTPSVPNGGRALPEGTTLTGKTPDGKKRQVDLRQVLKANLPTPRCCAGKRSAGMNRTEMYRAFRLLPTLTVGDSKQTTAFSGQNPILYQAVRRMPTVKATISGPDAARRNRKTSDGADDLATVIGGPLNPLWIEWYMGYPLEWTALPRSETPSSRKRAPKPSEGC